MSLTVFRNIVSLSEPFNSAVSSIYTVPQSTLTVFHHKILIIVVAFQDFIKYTSAQHGDCVILQMAQANIEGTAEFLNEAKRQAEQVAIVRYLSSRFDKLPFRLNETQQVLLRQDTVTFLVQFSTIFTVTCRRK